jgi:hypothetical protein
MLNKTEEIVWKALKGLPVTVIDTEQGELWDSPVWELVSPREDGSREIGSANMIAAYNLIHKHRINDDSIIDIFKNTIESLEEKKLIRRNPEIVRQSFKVV